MNLEFAQRQAIEIPHELSIAAEQMNLSYAETMEMFDAYNSVIARRSNRQQEPFDVDQWKKLHAAISKVFNPEAGALRDIVQQNCVDSGPVDDGHGLSASIIAG
jgi:hypothetical protein